MDFCFRRYAQPNANTIDVTESDSNGHGHSNGNGHCDGNSDFNRDGDSHS
jgi:hypothetical protein